MTTISAAGTFAGLIYRAVALRALHAYVEHREHVIAAGAPSDLLIDARPFIEIAGAYRDVIEEFADVAPDDPAHALAALKLLGVMISDLQRDDILAMAATPVTVEKDRSDALRLVESLARWASGLAVGERAAAAGVPQVVAA